MIRASVEHAVDTIRRAASTATGFATSPSIAPSSRVQPSTAIIRGRIAGLMDTLARGEVTSLELTTRAVERARAWPGIVTDLERAIPGALQSAADADERRAAGQPLGALAGVPVMVKDNVDVAGLVSGQGGALGRDEATTDSECWTRLRDAGSVLLGHTSMHELAWGLTTPQCPNPWGVTLTPGGSSGGGAACVAAGIVEISIGTDTGGSIRVPAALCGVAGLRPTHGISSMRGIAPLAPSLDTVGVMALTAADCVMVHELLSRPGAAAPSEVNGLRVGVLKGWQERVSAGVATAMEASSTALRKRGVQIFEVELAPANLAPSIAYVVMLIESSRHWLAEAERRSADVGVEVLDRLREGRRIDRADGLYELALSLAQSLREQALQSLRSLELAAFLSPVTAATGVLNDATDVMMINGRQVATADALSRYTALASVTGLPALSVPAGLESDCPTAVQLIGAPYDERVLAALARPIEQGPGCFVEQMRKNLGGSETLT